MRRMVDKVFLRKRMCKGGLSMLLISKRRIGVGHHSLQGKVPPLLLDQLVGLIVEHTTRVIFAVGGQLVLNDPLLDLGIQLHGERRHHCNTENGRQWVMHYKGYATFACNQNNMGYKRVGVCTPIIFTTKSDRSMSKTTKRNM